MLQNYELIMLVSCHFTGYVGDRKRYFFRKEMINNVTEIDFKEYFRKKISLEVTLKIIL